MVPIKLYILQQSVGFLYLNKLNLKFSSQVYYKS